MPYADHKTQSQDRLVPTAVITCSDTRTEATDVSGELIRRLLAAAGHPIVFYTISRDDPAQIRALLTQLAGRDDLRAIILNGGTGVAPRDNTFDAVSALLSKTLPGFGEIFRMLSYQTIGSGAMLSRATAGLIVPPPPAPPKIVFSIPGSPNAVELAMTKLIIPELSHLAWESTR